MRRSTRFNSWAIIFYRLYKCINAMYLYPDLQDISLFADDATAQHSSKCTQIITQKLQNVATSANKWCENNNMKLRIIKTKVALVGSKQRIHRITDSDKKIKIIFNDIPIEQVSHLLPTQSRILFFNFHIKPYLEYCCSIWGSTSQANINIVVKLQKRAA